MKVPNCCQRPSYGTKVPSATVMMGLHHRTVRRRVLNLACLLLPMPLLAQGNIGELHLKVQDPHGLGVKTAVELVCEASDFRDSYMNEEAGTLVAKRLPFGLYQLQIQQSGFSPVSTQIEVRSRIPVHYAIKLDLPSVSTSVTVEASATLLDPYRVNSANELGSTRIEN